MNESQWSERINHHVLTLLMNFDIEISFNNSTVNVFYRLTDIDMENQTFNIKYMITNKTEWVTKGVTLIESVNSLNDLYMLNLDLCKKYDSDELGSFVITVCDNDPREENTTESVFYLNRVDDKKLQDLSEVFSATIELYLKNIKRSCN